jgi:hypothetical protein
MVFKYMMTSDRHVVGLLVDVEKENSRLVLSYWGLLHGPNRVSGFEKPNFAPTFRVCDADDRFWVFRREGGFLLLFWFGSVVPLFKSSRY